MPTTGSSLRTVPGAADAHLEAGPWSSRRALRGGDRCHATRNGGAPGALDHADRRDFSTLGCHGQLDVIYADGGAGRRSRPAPKRKRKRSIASSRSSASGGEHKHILRGDADEALPPFAARQDYDLMILGALTRRRGASALHRYIDEPTRRCAHLRLRSGEGGLVRRPPVQQPVRTMSTSAHDA